MTPVGGLTVGVDVGGSMTKAVAVDPLGRVLRSAYGPTGPSGLIGASPGALASSITDCVDAVTDERGRRAVRAVGVALPGVVDVAGGSVRYALNMGIDGVPVAVAGPVSRAVGTTCVVENDVNAAALGAFHLLGLPGTASLAYLGFGTGIAAGFVLAGELWRGDTGAAGEIGHVRVDGSDRPCVCGRRGCLEAVASGSALRRRWANEDPAAAVSLFSAAGRGDRQAEAIRDDVVGAIASIAETVLLTLDVSVIALGGGICEVGPALVDAVVAAAESKDASALEHALDLRGRLVLTPEPDLVGAIGAALLAGGGLAGPSSPKTAPPP